MLCSIKTLVFNSIASKKVRGKLTTTNLHNRHHTKFFRWNKNQTQNNIPRDQLNASPPRPRPVPQPVPDLPARVAVAPPALPRRPNHDPLPILLPENQSRQSRQSNGWWNYFSRNRRRSENEQRPYIAPLTPPPVPNQIPAPPPPAPVQPEPLVLDEDPILNDNPASFGQFKPSGFVEKNDDIFIK